MIQRGDIAEDERLRAVRRYEILDTPPDGAFDRITALAARLFNVPMALVTIVDEERIWFKSLFGLSGIREIPRTPGLCASVICDDVPYIVENAQFDPRTLANPLVAGDFGLRFYAAAPIRTRDGHNLGTLCIMDKEPREMRGRDEAETLETLAQVVADQLDLRLSAIQTVRRERDLQVRATDTLQRALLPKIVRIPGVELDSIYRSASTQERVGGDWYDAFALGEDELLISIGDVTGHGLDSAVTMGKLRYALRALARSKCSPCALLDEMDAFLRRENAEMIATAFVARLDLANHTLIYGSAGHPPALVRAAKGSLTELETGALPLGLRSSKNHMDSHYALAAGDLLCLYTDGLTEATRDAIAGHERLRQRLMRADMISEPKPAHALAASLIPDELPDDVAILTARIS